MPDIEAGSSYTPVAKGFHWFMAAIWIAAWIIGFTAVHGGESLNPDHVTTILHKSIASTVVFLTALRLAWRFWNPAPPLPATLSPLAQNLAHGGHVLLYAIALVALPLSGWYWSSIVDKPIYVAGLIHLQPLAAPDPSLKLFARNLHVYTAWFCGLLVVGHALVALKHHFVDRDDILMRMSFLGKGAAAK